MAIPVMMMLWTMMATRRRNGAVSTSSGNRHEYTGRTADDRGRLKFYSLVVDALIDVDSTQSDEKRSCRS